MLELLDSLDDTELAEIEHSPDSMIYSPDATGPAPAALATPASRLPLPPPFRPTSAPLTARGSSKTRG